MTRPRPNLLITRPKADANRYLEALGPFAGQVVVSPVIEVVSGPETDWPGDAEAVILTSANALKYVSVPAGLRAWCVGDRTAEAARKAGLDARSSGGDAETLARDILKAAPSGQLVHLRGAHVASDLAGSLRAAGLTVAEQVVYDQRPKDLNKAALQLLSRTEPVILPVFSPRSSKALARSIAGPAPRHVVAISDAVATAAADLAPTRITTAETPDLPGMVMATKKAGAAI